MKYNSIFSSVVHLAMFLNNYIVFKIVSKILHLCSFFTYSILVLISGEIICTSPSFTRASPWTSNFERDKY
jgi:hypothetical protein